MSLRLDDGSQRISVSFDIAEESLGRAEVEVHIQTDRQMVQVVGDIEVMTSFSLFSLVYSTSEKTRQRYVTPFSAS